jgi:hypothetical protein
MASVAVNPGNDGENQSNEEPKDQRQKILQLKQHGESREYLTKRGHCSPP